MGMIFSWVAIRYASGSFVVRMSRAGSGRRAPLALLLVPAVLNVHGELLRADHEALFRRVERAVRKRSIRDRRRDGTLFLGGRVAGIRGDPDTLQGVLRSIDVDYNLVSGLEVILDRHLDAAVRSGGRHAQVPRVLGRLDLRRIERCILA